jgi:hypothetical protein
VKSISNGELISSSSSNTNTARSST